MDLRYRVPVLTYGFCIIWYFVLALFALTPGGWLPEITAADKALFWAFLGLMFTIPLGWHAIGTRRSGGELSAIIDFLRVHAEAGP